MKSEGLIESIRARLLDLSRDNGEAFDFVLSRFGIERFLYRLSRSREADQFVLKGATLFHVWNKKMHRPTRDLDLLGFGPDDVESVRASVLAIMRVEAPDDGLSLDEATLVVKSIRNDMAYGGVRAKFRAMLGNVRIPVQVDVGFGDAMVPGPETWEFPPLLIGLPTATLRIYPVCTVVAEKFEALVRLDAQNTRMKDFFDLDFLLKDGTLDSDILRQAILATFKRRDAELPADVPTGLTDAFARSKQVMWNAFLRKNGLESQTDELSAVIARIREALQWVWQPQAD
jgi:predicted nucleotidyltransferase component of viral defense system